MAELKDAASAFRHHKLLLTKSYRKLHRYIVEQYIESLEGHRTHMIGLFKDIVIDCHRDKRMTPQLNYFNDNDNDNDNELFIQTKSNEKHHKGNINNTYKNINITTFVPRRLHLKTSWPLAYNHL